MGRFSPTVQEQRFSPLAEALSQGTRNFLTFFDAARRRKMEDEDRRRMDEARQYEMSQRPLREALMEAQLREQGIRPAAEAADTTFQVPTLGAGGFEAMPAPATLAKELRFRPLGESGRVLDIMESREGRRRNERAESQRLANALFERQQESARQAGDLQFTRQKELAGVQAENARRLAAQQHTNALVQLKERNRLAQEAAEAAAQRAMDAAAQQPAKPLTAQQAQAAGFARRMNVTGQRIAEMEDKGLGLPTIGNEMWGSVPMIGGALQNRRRTPEQQAYQTLAENWVTANLRKESGAVIGKDEMAQEVRKYFPLATDHPETIKLKREMRRIAEQNMWLMANSAPDPTVSVDPDDQPRQYSPDNPYAPR